MMDLSATCLRARDLLFILPVANWHPMRTHESWFTGDPETTHSFWAPIFPQWSSGTYVETKLATAAHFITQYLEEGDAHRLTFTARYINLFFGDDDVWDRSLREAISSRLNGSPAWADKWRQELLTCGYELAVAAACRPPSWISDDGPVIDLTSQVLSDEPRRG